MAFCEKHAHAFVNVCSECKVEQLKAAQHTVQRSVFDVAEDEELEANDETFAFKL